MQPIIKDINELSDSKEMYETKPHPFISIFIYILLACIILASIWLYFGEVDMVSKGLGVVRPNENISAIRNKVGGEVTLVQMEEGQVVRAGDVLFEIAHDDLEIKRLQVADVLEECKKSLDYATRFKESVEQGKNLFSKVAEKEYYDRYVKYEQDYVALKNEGKLSAQTEVISNNQIQINREIYKSRISEYEGEIGSLELLEKSVLEEKSYFEDQASSYALQFNTYIFKVYELNKEIETKKQAYGLALELDAAELIAKQELEDAKVALDMARNELDSLKMNTLKGIKDQIKEITMTKTQADQELSKLIIDDTLASTHKVQRELTISQYQTDSLVQLYNEIDELEQQHKSQLRELEAIELSIEACTVTAPINGTLNITTDMSKGDLLAGGIDIATIIPDYDSMYKIEIFIPNKEIAGIKEGDKIQYKFDALPYKEYGQLTGTIKKISTDAKVNTNLGVSGYYIQGSIENKTIYSYKNKPAEIKVGMTCEAHVVTEQKKILYYLLEKINLKD